MVLVCYDDIYLVRRHDADSVRISDIASILSCVYPKQSEVG